VRPYLLDVNVLLAIHWVHHESHGPALEWFRREGERAFAFCMFTETGFVRLLTNPAFMGKPATMSEAGEALRGFASLKGYRYWPMLRTFEEMTESFRERLHGHRQVTDACLLGLAIERKGSLATLDRAIRHLAGNECMQHVTLIGS
jgi:toxin-antitoxin system PIN domain toxin